MTTNEIPRMPTENELKILCAEFGDKAVEQAMIAIQHAYDRKGLRVMIRPTAERVRDVLEAIYGRLSVGAYRVSLEKPQFPKAWV